MVLRIRICHFFYFFKAPSKSSAPCFTYKQGGKLHLLKLRHQVQFERKMRKNFKSMGTILPVNKQKAIDHFYLYTFGKDCFQFFFLWKIYFVFCTETSSVVHSRVPWSRAARGTFKVKHQKLFSPDQDSYSDTLFSASWSDTYPGIWLLIPGLCHSSFPSQPCPYLFWSWWKISLCHSLCSHPVLAICTAAQGSFELTLHADCPPFQPIYLLLAMETIKGPPHNHF